MSARSDRLPANPGPALPDGGQNPVFRKRGKFTIKASRLLGSPRCLNCNTELLGPYCHYCGQPDRNFLRFFPALAREFMEDIFELDSRFTRTLLPLLFKPGKLTRDYLDGRRFRYTPPLRLYLFSSMAFFLFAATLAGNAIDIYNLDNPGSIQSRGFGIQIQNPEELKEAQEALDNLDPAVPGIVRKEIDKAVEAERRRLGELDTEGDVGTDDFDDPYEGFNFNGRPWNRETNPLVIPGVPGFINHWINDEIEESPQKGKEIESNPNIIVEKIFDVLPLTMFFLLPVVALLFKFWYLFARRYYFEHLMHALHNHSFLFVVLLISLLGDSLAGWFEPSEVGPWTISVQALNVLLLSWIPFYLLISLRRVYQQNWFLTVLKFGVIGVSYLILLGLAAGVVAVLSFVLL